MLGYLSCQSGEDERRLPSELGCYPVCSICRSRAVGRSCSLHIPRQRILLISEGKTRTWAIPVCNDLRLHLYRYLYDDRRPLPISVLSHRTSHCDPPRLPLCSMHLLLCDHLSLHRHSAVHSHSRWSVESSERLSRTTSQSIGTRPQFRSVPTFGQGCQWHAWKVGRWTRASWRDRTAAQARHRLRPLLAYPYRGISTKRQTPRYACERAKPVLHPY